jgi:hypothetical protein
MNTVINCGGGTVKGIEYLDQVNNCWLLKDSAVGI